MGIRHLLVLFVVVLLVLVVCDCRQHYNRNRRRGGAKDKALALHHQENEFHNKGKICIGTNGRMSVPSNREHHYRNLKDRYTNCTYVDGNLELTWLQDENLDLSFLQYIREVTGYVLISHVDIKRIVLPRLQIIRGRTLFKMNVRNEEFALLVILSKMYTLELPALRDVLIGNVGVFNNYNLCHFKTINWKEIITDPKSKYVFVYNFTSPERDCPPCHKNCEKGCWGEGEENCQKFSKENCSPQCYQGRCFGPNPRECCHLFCAGGCTGPKQSDCIACRNFYDDGVCTQECPPMKIYSPITYSWQDNPNGKYAYGATCVKNCPEHLLKDNGACVRSCPPDKKAHEGACVPCNGPCPKTCRVDTFIHSGNIDTFKGCTVIEGNILILQNTFEGYQHFYPNYTFGARYPRMHPDRLEVFSTLKEVTGHINVQAYHSDFTNLSYFRNLEVIGGRSLSDYFTSLYIVKSSLKSLELRSLKRLNAGTVAILENTHLCFADNINWDKIRRSHEHVVMISNNSDPRLCKGNNLVCDSECSRDGCWGAGPDQCLSCAHFQLENESRCIANCSVLPGIYQDGPNICKRCHEECGSSCTGPGADKCVTCKRFQDGPYCVPSCPTNKYHENGQCKSCHANCVGGCTGPTNIVGLGGCNSCDRAIMNETDSMVYCLGSNESCPDGYFNEYLGPQEKESLKSLAGSALCRKCHPRCKICSGFGFHELVCQKCTHYKKDEQCEDECRSGDYADEEVQECKPCDPECKGCTGPGPENCISCENFKVFDDGYVSENSSFRCVSSCPPEFPHRVFPDNAFSYCSDKPLNLPISGFVDNNYTVVIATGITSAIIIIIIIIILVTWFFRKKVKAEESTLKMTMALTGLEDNEPLRQTNVSPNCKKLRTIKETEIRRGDILGYGAFGTVYKGVWILEDENNSKIPVAIKVLRDGSTSSKEFLSEAFIMASVEHPNLLQLLGVCMTSEIMLITQLMPLGCLLDFVRKNRDRIGAKALLNWSTQIAKGMAYLEEKRLVHRDLAARNVLVQTHSCVKITDFGLAKLLDVDEDEYKAAGGKMPIKWLALECIQHRIFTHKSDVWAFGVTIWELLTFGERPYDNVPARDVPELLEKGERLPQPEGCSIDVYMILVKCWILDAESRPSFKELAEDFTKMARDPCRYLAITADRFARNRNNAQDDRKLVHTLASTLETSASQSECDEYLQPKSRAPLRPVGWMSSVSPSPTPDKYWKSASQTNSDGSCNPQYQNHLNRKLLKYPPSTASDTLKMRDDMSSDEYDSGPSKAQLGSLKLDLPVDEDDYLMPSPQQTQGASAYVDLIDSKNSDTSNQSVFRSLDFYKSNIDNPEYLMNNEAAPSQTVGLPQVPRSSEEESDHEYYNDFDRLKRELQPLQRNKDGAIV
ncbi:epidermal growth factor receptor isoform X1 [Tribolium castaneum]|uniref:Receptor protein-tyrosine kinase n=1 Tax=Tribolium castaneum TaxID=7070 RepID=D6WIE7_TRICA|nr:PREDICTED: epidermal growth factor receptor isoform X1 [Tribolium castaneum]XP_015834203.1 PREDICTED: epidermal growth factor receptor isoform X1 [Tribolium castaneum]EFA01355.2 torpedo [Tribolium castaneum]|eukprot:XP_008191493.1 PREDICTED: epidermal growth factor receptor isoform X1 [Tribolium castaneum]